MSLLSAKHEEVFKQVGDIAEEFRSNAVRSATFKPIVWFQDRLNILTGCFMYLSAEYARMRAARDNNEVTQYMICKSNSAASGEKFTSAVGEREARASVNEFVEAEKVLEAYKDAAEQGILTCKKNIDVLAIELQRESK